MRFDDMLATVLAQPRSTPRARETAWRQVVDLVAQGRGGVGEADALAFLRQARGEVPVERRKAVAAAIARFCTAPALVELFGEDAATVAAPVIAQARLSAAEWLALLPRLSPAARALLRHRRDLDPAVERALASFGAADRLVEGAMAVVFEEVSAAEAPTDDATDALVAELQSAMAYPGEASPTEDTAGSEAATAGERPRPSDQIRELLSRIERFRRGGPAEGAAPPHAGEAAVPAASFTYEADTEGLIFWVDGVPRGPVIGHSIARPAEAGEHGVDGQAAGAFRRRAAFRSARLTIAGVGPAAGDWRISAVPFFDPASGRFLGYRGSGRRPRPDETAAPEGGLFGSGLSPESLRQLVHELRTPINAIQGFADMIAGEMLGPVRVDYRDRARDISGHARRLLVAVDDLDVASRLEMEDGSDRRPATVDMARLVERVEAEFRSLAHERGVVLEATLAGSAEVAVEPARAERMVTRLIGATIGLAANGERLWLRLDDASDEAGSCVFSIARPAALGQRSEAELLDPGFTPDGDFPDAPALGLGFALRLVRNLARSAGGRLEIEPRAFRLLLPGGHDAAESGRHSG